MQQADIPKPEGQEDFVNPVTAENADQGQPVVEQEERAEALLNLDELNKKYAVDKLCGPTSMADIKKGLPGLNWVSLYRNSPFNQGEWEMFLGGYTTGCANDGAWKALDAGGNSEYAVEVGMFREVDTAGGKKLIPTEKCLKFIQERLGRFTE